MRTLNITSFLIFMVEAVGTSETSVSTGLHGATSQKTFVFTLLAVTT
jgi:hypothetical protein